MSRERTLFCLRYAVRVLERHARLWRRADTLIRFTGLLAGTSAFAALMAGNGWATGIAGVTFAVLQGIEYTIRPAFLAAESQAAKRLYSSVLGNQTALTDDAIEAAYQQAVAEDEVVVPEVLRHLAYNDVILERGLDRAEMFDLGRWHRFVAFFA